jgi:hypothetical protein
MMMGEQEESKEKKNREGEKNITHIMTKTDRETR